MHTYRSTLACAQDSQLALQRILEHYGVPGTKQQLALDQTGLGCLCYDLGLCETHVLSSKQFAAFCSAAKVNPRVLDFHSTGLATLLKKRGFTPYQAILRLVDDRVA